jgi:hypothetical protein
MHARRGDETRCGWGRSSAGAGSGQRARRGRASCARGVSCGRPRVRSAVGRGRSPCPSSLPAAKSRDLADEQGVCQGRALVALRKHGAAEQQSGVARLQSGGRSWRLMSRQLSRLALSSCPSWKPRHLSRRAGGRSPTLVEAGSMLDSSGFSATARHARRQPTSLGRRSPNDCQYRQHNVSWCLSWQAMGI